MRNARLVNHTTIATVKTILFLSQIASLAATMNLVPGEDGRNAWETYVRNTIKSEEEAQVMTPKS